MKIGFYSDLVLGNHIRIDSRLEDKFREADINCANLECPIYSGRKKSKKKGVCLYSKTKDLSFLQQYNFKVVNLANNHIMDFGVNGMLETIQRLNDSDIEWFGAGENKKQAYKPYIVCSNDMKIAIFGFAWKYTGATVAKEHTAGVAGIIIKEIRAVLEAYKSYDRKIAYFHFGTEFEDIPEPYLKRLTEELMEEGYLDVIIGNHPHCIQGVYKKVISGEEKVCFYSLGNLIIPEGEYYKGTLRYPEKSNLGFGVLYDTETNSYEYVPYKIVSKGRELQTIHADILQERLEQYSKPLYLSDVEYQIYYKKNRKNRKRPVFRYSDSRNALISVPFLVKKQILFFIIEFIKGGLHIFGVKPVRDEKTGKRILVPTREKKG